MLAKSRSDWPSATEIKIVLRARQESARQESGAPGIANLRIGISEPLWPREYWDRYIRNEKHLQAAIAYIEQNQ